MKEYIMNASYRGRYFDFRFCAKTHKIASNIIGCSISYLTKYGFCNKIDEPYLDIFVKPYCHQARKDIGHNNEILFEDAKKKIDKIAEKWNKKQKNKH